MTSTSGTATTLTEFDVHDVLNVFQCTGLNENDQYFMKDCPAR
ncbi:DUF1989 domain-containing protein [Streptomyces libani]